MSIDQITPAGERTTAENPSLHPVVPLLDLLRTRRHTWVVSTALVLALALGWYLVDVAGAPLWKAAAAFIAVMVLPMSLKWRADARSYGAPVAVAGALVVVQGLHGVEHVYQWIQRHLLDLPLRQSNGLLSPANTEWVHFVWNWLVLAVVTYLVARGMRSGWAWLFLIWVVAHTFEHSYMMWRYVVVDHQLNAFGFPDITSQGLPGIVGNDGWLDRNARGQFAFLCNIPFATTATRLDAHAAWNVGETLLMIPAVHVFLRRLGRRPRLDESSGIVALRPTEPSNA